MYLSYVLLIMRGCIAALAAFAVISRASLFSAQKSAQ